MDNEIDKQGQIYSLGFKAGEDHNFHASKETKILIDNLKDEFKIIMDNITSEMRTGFARMDKGFEENSKEHRDIRGDFTCALKEKADKVVVDEIRGDIRKIVWIIVGAVVLAVMGLILK
jgi:hypothetical protein